MCVFVCVCVCGHQESKTTTESHIYETSRWRNIKIRNGQRVWSSFLRKSSRTETSHDGYQDPDNNFPAPSSYDVSERQQQDLQIWWPHIILFKNWTYDLRIRCVCGNFSEWWSWFFTKFLGWGAGFSTKFFWGWCQFSQNFWVGLPNFANYSHVRKYKMFIL